MSDYTSIIGVEVLTKWGYAVILKVAQYGELFLFLASARTWEMWIEETDIVEELGE